MAKHPPSIRILLLEDDLETVSLIAEELVGIEQQLQEKGLDLSLVVLSEYTMVQQYINSLDIHQYHIVLLDRDCKIGGSFHVLDLERFNKDNIVSISSTPKWNEEAAAKGIKRIVQKDFEALGQFVNGVADHLRDMLGLPDPYKDFTDDPLLPRAIQVIQATGKASASVLQRKLRIGYARSARLLDQMEEAGIIGPAEGNSPRTIK